jgi:arylmalonate decarboxylase
MRHNITIGLVVPFAEDKVPVEGLQMYPGVRFIAKGVGVRALTPEGYDAAFRAIVPAAVDLARQNVDAIMVIGTSLTFYRGAEAHADLIAELRAATGLPASTMSEAVVEGLKAFAARRIAVATAYGDEVNRRLKDFLVESGFEVAAIAGFGIEAFGAAAGKTEADIVDLGLAVCGEAERPHMPQALLISCGGLRTLGVAAPIEARCGVPVVSSTQAAFWSALRLVGESGQLAGFGRLLAGQWASAPVH